MESSIAEFLMRQLASEQLPASRALVPHARHHHQHQHPRQQQQQQQHRHHHHHHHHYHHTTEVVAITTATTTRMPTGTADELVCARGHAK